MNVFTSQKKNSVGSLGEENVISQIRRWLGRATPPSPFGIGDDCAVLPASALPQVITVDPIIYGRHFDENVSPRAVGAKLLKRNLSDIAAMGAKPTAAVVSLSLAANVSTRWLQQFYQGLAAEARRFHVQIVGGDVSQIDSGFVASLTLLGRASGKRILTRQGAKIGDVIYVTGKLGGSILGHHFKFSPRLAEGTWLANRSEVRALMDLSDGLAKDLRALTPAKARAALNPIFIPISSAAHRLAKTSNRSPLAHALADGEDYELVIVVRGRAARENFESAWALRFNTPLTYIGKFVSQTKPIGDEVALANFRGYEHLR